MASKKQAAKEQTQALTVVEAQPVETPQAMHQKGQDVAQLCKQIVLKTALVIKDEHGKPRKYVQVEGWQSIATTYGCVASSRNVQADYGPDGKLMGFKATGEVRRLSDGVVVGEAEGYVGTDETTWFGGKVQRFNRQQKRWEWKTYPRRADYAIRAMAQTRAVSRACRAAFSFVVVLMDEEGLETVPAAEVPPGGFQDNAPPPRQEEDARKDTQTRSPQEHAKGPPGGKRDYADWRDAVILHGKTNKGRKLGELKPDSLAWYIENWDMDERTGQPKDTPLRRALDQAQKWLVAKGEGQPDAPPDDWRPDNRGAETPPRQPSDNDGGHPPDDDVPF